MLFCLLTACYIKCPPAARFLSHVYFLMTQQSGRIYETRINLFWKAEVLANNPRLCQRLNVYAQGCLMPALWQWERRGKCRGFEMSPTPRERLWDERAPLGPPKISWAHQERECLRRADILHKTSSLYKERGNYQTVCTSQGGQLPERKVRSSVLLQVLYRRIDCSPGLIAGADTLGLTRFCLLGLTESSWHSSRTVICFHQLRSLHEGWSAEWIELCYVIIGILHFNLNKLIKYFSKIIQFKILKRIDIYIYIKKTRHIYIY